MTSRTNDAARHLFTPEEIRQRGFDPKSFDLEWLNQEWVSYCDWSKRTYGDQEAEKELAKEATRNNFLVGAFLTG